MTLQNITNNPMNNMEETDLIIEDDNWLGEPVFSDSEEENEYLQRAYETLGITIATQNTLTNTGIQINKTIRSPTKKIVTPLPSQCDKGIMCVIMEETEQTLKCDTGSQCNLVLETADLAEIVKLCASLDTKNYVEFSDLITVCRNIINPVKVAVKTKENRLSKYGETVSNSFAQKMEVDTCVSSKFRPSRHSISPEFQTEECIPENQMVLSKSVEHQPEADIEESNNNKRRSGRKNQRFSNNLSFKKPLNKKQTIQVNNKCDTDNSSPILRRSSRPRKAAVPFSSEAPSKSENQYIHHLKRLNDKQSTKKTNKTKQFRCDKSAKELIENYLENLPPGQVITSSKDNAFKQPLKKVSKTNNKNNGALKDIFTGDDNIQVTEPLKTKICRSLARNFMNKTYDSQLEQLRKGSMNSPQKQFISFQSQPKKKLYSPDYWLDVYKPKDEYLEHKKQKLIFNN